MSDLPKLPGFSAYLTSFDRQREMLERGAGSDAPVFLSLHIAEEFSPDYCARAEAVCHWLRDAGYRPIADVSRRTMEQFGEDDLAALARRLGLWALRLDYGLTEDEICALAHQMPVVLNASTTTPEAAAKIAAAGDTVLAMHNFYPRPETGLDDGFFRSSTRSLRAAGLQVLAFIPGDGERRGPLREGLPTLERHRYQPPSACFADLSAHFEVDGIFVGDISLTQAEQERIRAYCREGIIRLPARLDEGCARLYGQVFTNRPDAPAGLVRFAESRLYATAGPPVQPARCLPRTRGSITLDNVGYGRYSGELQLVRQDLPADGRVNVIGQVPQEYLLLADCIGNGEKFVLVPAQT